MSTITCPSCSAASPAGAIFCDNCGYDLRNVPESAPQPVTPTVSASASGGLTCQSCGHINLTDSAFCENCGIKLGAVPVEQPTPQQQPQPADQPPPPQTPPAEPPAASPAPQPLVDTPQTPPAETISGHLVIQSTNTSLPIPSGKKELTLGREDPVSSIFPDIDLTPYGAQDAGVGRHHARIRILEGDAYIEDLNSVNGTLVNKEPLPAGQLVKLNNGDEIRLGLLIINFYSS